MGIEPTSKAWEALILPMNYARKGYLISNSYYNENWKKCKVLFCINIFQKFTFLLKDFFVAADFLSLQRAYYQQ